MLSVPRRLARKYVSPELVRRARGVRRAATGAVDPAEDRPDSGSPAVEPLISALREGSSLTAGLFAEVRELVRVGDLEGATSIAAALSRDQATEAVGNLCFGYVAFQRNFRELAWQKFSGLPLELWSQHAPTAYVRSGIEQDLDVALAHVRELVALAPAYMPVKRWMNILEAVYAAGEMDLAREIFAVLDDVMAREPNLTETAVVRRDWMRRWIDLSPTSPTAPPPSADVSFAIMDYDHPGRSRASANIGDHVQTLASLGHLVRHQDLSFQGSQDLVELVTQLGKRVRPELRRSGHTASVQVMKVDRDATIYNEVPEDTWTLAFGWYMHALFKVRFAFPFHANLRPIFVSFHCNKHSMLTPEAVEYLRECGPIGCRDWTTVDILLSVGVPAFFSGCLTTTVNTVFPDVVDAFPASGPVAYVDSPDDAPPGAVEYRHSYDGVRFRSFTDNMFEAVSLLETYRREHSAIVTSRLHCYLPMRSLGANVDFRPRTRSDIRFAGLIDITDGEFDAIQTGMNDRLEKVFGAILDGGSREDVYGLWRELCADDVELARQRREAAPVGALTPTDVGDDLKRAVAGSDTVGTPDAQDAVHVAVRVDTSQPDPLRVLVDSLVSQASRPLHLWLLDSSPDGIDPDDVARWGEVATVTVVPTRNLGVELRGPSKTARRRSRVDFEQLMLPGLLPDVDRVVVLPLHALVVGDVAELAALDLGDHSVAAPDVAGKPESSGFDVIHNAGTRLGNRTTLATELRRRAHARHAFDFTAFDTHVLVLDLVRLRDAGTVTEAVQLVEEFGLTPRQVLHFQVGPNRAVVPRRWNVVPTRNHADPPALLHWADRTKPWSPDYAPAQEQWFEREGQPRHRLSSTS